MMDREVVGSQISQEEKIKLKQTSRILVFVLGFGFAPWLVAQQTATAPSETGGRMSAVAQGESILNLDKLKDEVKQYYACSCKCGCYQKDLDLQANRAIAFLRRRAAHVSAKEKLALVLDIDETTLSNYQEMVGADFAYDSNTFNAWVESGKAPAIPATLRIYKEAQKLSVPVFFLTGRPESQRDVTEKNLRAVGFDGWQELILRSQAQTSLTALDFKSAEREKIVAEGYRIVLNVGDQWSDLRGKATAEYSVKYPDPFYFLK
jgi:acid phosphatase